MIAKQKKVILILIVLFSLVNFVYLVLEDTNPVSWDQSAHLLTSNYYFEKLILFKDNSGLLNKYPVLHLTTNYYPPGQYVLTVLFYLMFGINSKIALMVNFLFLIILILSTYKIGEKLFSWKHGLLAAFIISTMPTILMLSKEYFLDIGATAFVSLSVYFILRTNYFEKKNESIQAGLIIGFALLIKWTTAIFIVSFLIGYFAYSLFKTKKNIKNIILCFISASIICLPWYINNFKELYFLLLNFIPVTITPNISLLDKIFFYAQLIPIQATYVYTIFFFIGIILILKSKEKHIYLLSWIVISYIIISFVSNRSIRISVNFLPAIAIIGSVALNKIKKKSIISLVIIFLVIQTIALVFFGVSKPIVPRQEYALEHTNFDDWHIEQILLLLNQTYKNKSLEVLVDKHRFNDINFQYYSYINNINLKTIYGPYEEFGDIVIVSDSIQGITSRSEEFRKANEEFFRNEENYLFIREYHLPDDDIVKLYVKK